jgi:hypothetical protein
MTAKDTTAAYATWGPPEAQFTVTYSLPLFHEIDFLVNEAYRRIPHGGIEIGGLLFGRLDGNSLRLEAFRLIDCEHASGPSFSLSARDLALLSQQLVAAASDAELGDLEAVGWFIAHTRSELRMNDRESNLFGELFPEPRRITVLIKPEKFQPTRFGFLIRDSDGRVDRDASENAIILPLPGRTEKASGSNAIPSIPAPAQDKSSDEAAFPGQDEREADRSPENPPQTLPSLAPSLLQGGTNPSPQAGSTPSRAKITHEELTANGVSNRLSIALSREPIIPEASREQSREIAEPLFEPASGALVKGKAAALELHKRAVDPHDTQYQLRPSIEADKGLNLRLATTLLLAAVLGCALGYWAYQRITPSAIPLTVEPKSSTLLVSWPIEETRDAGFAALKIDDGNPTTLTPEQKASGEAEINLGSDNMKVELIVQHRISDARGIVRYVRAPKLPVSQNP